MYPKVRYLKCSRYLFRCLRFCFLNLKKDNVLLLSIGFRISKNYLISYGNAAAV